MSIVLNRGVAAIHNGSVETNCSYADQRSHIDCDAVVLVVSPKSHDALYLALMARIAEWPDAGVKTVSLIGDAAAPGPIAWANYAGHRCARELDETDRGDALCFRREVTELADA